MALLLWDSWKRTDSLPSASSSGPAAQDATAVPSSSVSSPSVQSSAVTVPSASALGSASSALRAAAGVPSVSLLTSSASVPASSLSSSLMSTPSSSSANPAAAPLIAPFVESSYSSSSFSSFSSSVSSSSYSSFSVSSSSSSSSSSPSASSSSTDPATEVPSTSPGNSFLQELPSSSSSSPSSSFSVPSTSDTPTPTFTPTPTENAGAANPEVILSATYSGPIAGDAGINDPPSDPSSSGTTLFVNPTPVNAGTGSATTIIQTDIPSAFNTGQQAVAKSNTKTAQILGGVLGGLSALLVIILAAFIWRRYRRKRVHSVQWIGALPPEALWQPRPSPRSPSFIMRSPPSSDFNHSSPYSPPSAQSQAAQMSEAYAYSADGHTASSDGHGGHPAPFARRPTPTISPRLIVTGVSAPAGATGSGTYDGSTTDLLMAEDDPFADPVATARANPRVMAPSPTIRAPDAVANPFGEFRAPRSMVSDSLYSVSTPGASRHDLSVAYAV
ncbi:hypothetical protein SCP_0102010 [Sparassis crispa]|uniref:REJ domain-containing protein n=1 Tax=Sparassis crispa TaxID=139825 RepID=A0A401G583_9APHY|nr:hypothetical protein SCP_0102010 [Sparassis crispa]GBE77328.1 hypothetical protein SCP_0102010 [Sparassis crispa]